MEIKRCCKEKQVELIDYIMCNLCACELNKNGRKFLNKLKNKINGNNN